MSQWAGQQFAELIAFVLLILLFLLVQAITLLVRVFVRYPEVKKLWIVLGVTLGCWLVGGACLAADPHGWGGATFGILGAFSFLVLLIVAKVVELRHDDMLLEEPRPGLMLDRVLHRSWWPAA